ncbi:hypothetical protein KKI24_09050 [bacterium]|nr:hypothetical protein [bacterium]
MAIESFSLVFMGQTEKAIKVAFECAVKDADGRRGNGFKEIYLPKSQIEVDGVSHESDFDDLVRNEVLDVYIPDWLAEEKGLL